MSSKEELASAWEGCVRAGMRAKVGVEDELGKGVRANVSPFRWVWVSLLVSFVL